ncbi:hypothetical protein C6P40_003116 [Pichia californica]|uniref:Carboxylic ester hydrolase n=1 Tax=Pichia californica TaxID=460514 RepID=A0A9P6WHP6_9ASCO|nr:hypothetical protein C6P42_004385 [[Candida] californica]KAG0686954.1 hypothetical protein C6P40_003116 [[Candida] californica]
MGQSISTEKCTPFVLETPKNGKLTGLTFENPETGIPSCHRFGKVPYAYTCEKETRFTLPKSLPDDYDYTGEYKELGLKCPQPSVPNKHFRYTKSPSEENIQYNNIWVPASDKYKPKSGWPVLIFIHGGWLQYNTPNTDNFNVVELFGDEEFHEKFILVTPGYRLNIFGFLSGKELLEEDPKNSNFGFWDQRMAIEWTYDNISKFGGDPEKITVGGLSAGSYSTFFQLAYELYNPKVKQIIKQCCFFSNLVYIQPKTIEESQDQFDEIIDKLKIDKSLSSAEKLQKLRELDTDFIEDFIPTLTLHTFRAVTDNYFISSEIMKDLDSGKFSLLMKEKNLRILNGEVDNELVKYSLLNTPTTIDELPIQVENYYPRSVVPTLLDLYEANVKDFEGLSGDELKEALRVKYGAIVSDGQVYASARGLINKLIENGFPASDIFRYRISYRAKWLDEHLEKEWLVPHGGDFTIWFYNLRKGYTEEEKIHVHNWIVPYIKFLNFDKNIEEWPTSDPKKIRLFKTDGSAEYIEDPDWDWGVKVSNAVYTTQVKALY